METTRPARPEDRTTCADLLTEAVAHARAARGGAALIGTTTPDALLERWLGAAAPISTVVVGEFHHVVVGLAAATAAVPAQGTALTGRIECCYVEEGARGVGVGSALMASVVAWCAAQGCGAVDALALPGDRSSKQRFEAAGFTARLLVLSRPLN